MGLTLALPKGRLLESCLALLSAAGLAVAGISNESRRLVHDVPQDLPLDPPEGGPGPRRKLESMRFVVVRASDVPVYVDYGAADLGIAGKDVLLEYQRDVYELLDLGFGECRFVVAAPKDLAGLVFGAAGTGPGDTATIRLPGLGGEPSGHPPGLDWIAQLSPVPVRVATKFPNVARRYFRDRGIAAEVIALHGSTELAPVVGLAQVVVDIASTGRTLAENDLVVLGEIERATARLVANRASFRLKSDEVDAVVRAIARAAARSGGGTH